MTKVRIIPSTIDPLTQLPKNSKEKVKVAAYARVSTNTEEQYTSYEAQVNYYKDYIQRKSDWIYVDVYADEGLSGTNTRNRPSFNKMINDALNGEINLIITKSISRFARNTLDTIKYVRKLKNKGVEVYFEKENLWTLDSKSELILTIMASIAQEESRSLSQNITWGKRASFQAGKVSFAYSWFLGYEKKGDKLVIVEEEAKLVRRIYRMFLVEGLSPTAIAKTLKEEGVKTASGTSTNWQTNNVTSILRNEKYKGDALLQKTFVENYLEQKIVKNTGQIPQYYVSNNHPPIIDEDMWELAQAEFERRKGMKTSFSSVDIFSSKLICADCGAFYGRKKWHSGTKYERFVYQCNRKYTKGKDVCKTPHLTEEQIKLKFLNSYNLAMSDKKRIENDLKEVIRLLTDTKDIEKEITKLNVELLAVTELINKLIQENSKTNNGVDEYDKKLKALKDRYDDIKERRDKLVNSKSENLAKSYRIKTFLADIEKSDNRLREWNDNIWMLMVESAKVYRSKSIRFKFYNGLITK